MLPESSGYVVMGAGLGDEGKGLMVDWLSRHYSSKHVARFNGGAQAGHTVVTPEGLRHVFGHVAAGTFARADTILGHRFIVNPYLLESEIDSLDAANYQPRIYIHEMAPVSTIFDMALNVAQELARGDKRHGSCGLGINETVTRHRGGWRLTARDVHNFSRPQLAEVLANHLRVWVPYRLGQLGLTDLPPEFHLQTGEVLKNTNFMEHARRIKSGLSIGDIRDWGHMPRSKHMIFEGAQGLQLDEVLGTFPHVTRSKTGLPYAIETAGTLELTSLQPIYVTRCYATRHGAGPLAHEGEIFTQLTIKDTTNVNNEWQGRLRFAPLDCAVIHDFIERDVQRNAEGRIDNTKFGHDIDIRPPVLAITCLDQIGYSVVMYDRHGSRRVVAKEDVTWFIQEETGVTVRFTSHGPTCADVVQVTQAGV